MSAMTATAPARQRSSTSPAPEVRRKRPAPLEALEPTRSTVRMLGTAALVSILGVLLLMAMFHALIVQGQRELDRMNADIETATSVNDRLQLELAQMEAPERIVAAARSYGMVDAPEVVYLSPAVENQEAAGQ